MTPRLLCPALFAAALAASVGVRAQNPETPFAPSSSPGASANPADTIEFAGVISGAVNGKPNFIFQDRTTKRKTWVTEGKPAGGIEVVSYDPRTDQVVVKINGTQKTLALKKNSATVNAPAPVAPPPPPQPTGFVAPAPNLAAPAASPPASTPAGASNPTGVVEPAAGTGGPTSATTPAPNTPEARQKAETEARMLVSDLLEIGMAQRKAYEEAQRKAQQAGGSQGNAPAHAVGSAASSAPAASAANGATSAPPAPSQTPSGGG